MLAVILAIALLAAPLAADAQEARTPQKIGFLGPGTRPGWSEPILPSELVRQALRELGYLEGHNISVHGAGSSDSALLRTLAADLVRLNVAVIIAVGQEAIQAAKEASTSIPIVMLAFADPVEARLVAGLARPGGNITGLSLLTADLGEKRLALLRESLPRVSRIAVLWNPAHAEGTTEWHRTRAAAQRLGLTLVPLECRTPEDIDAAFATVQRSRVGALVVVLDPLTFAQGTRIIQLAARNRLPAMYGSRAFVEKGGLMAYQPSNRESARRIALFVDKILKGTKADDLPVEQPTTFELVINLKTAKALGLTIPPSVLVRADQVIE